MKIVICDGQGGKLGAQLIKALNEKLPENEIIAVGTNSLATSAMIKAGAKKAATGENAVKVACVNADIIVGPLGIAIPDALLGEVTPEIAKYVAQSNAKRVLIPSGKCDNLVVGVTNFSLSYLINAAVEAVVELTKQ